MCYPVEINTYHTNILLNLSAEFIIQNKSEVSYSIWHLLGYLQSKVIDSKFTAGPLPTRYVDTEERKHLQEIAVSLDSLVYGSFIYNDDDPIDGYDMYSFMLTAQNCLALLSALDIRPPQHSTLPTH